MTVQENLTLGLYVQRDRASVQDWLSYAYDVFPQLGSKARQVAGQLAVAEPRMLELARALIRMPRLVLIDELSSGLKPAHAGLLDLRGAAPAQRRGRCHHPDGRTERDERACAGFGDV